MVKAAPAAARHHAEMTPNPAKPALIASLGRVLGGRVRTIETHISYVLLTGEFAYKIKKPVDLGFLDFSTLASRKHYCEEELRLNRRLAPQLYLDVLPITGTFDAPVLAGEGPAIEYALRMREFGEDALHALARGAIGPAFADDLAAQVAALHAGARAADTASGHGDRREILDLALRNFDRLRATLTDPARLRALDALRAWSVAEHAAIGPVLDQRRTRARVRECHGDLHLGNIAHIDGRPVIFDCIEFSDALRYIDVMSEVAFVVMDFRRRAREDLGHRFLDRYLEITGDYEGLRVLRFYLVYRAMVRAMVAGERRGQAAGPDGDATFECRAYVDLAASYAFERDPALIITHGFSGSGKSIGSQSLIETLAGVRIRTDVERKRLHGLEATARGAAGSDAVLYSQRSTQQVYARVFALARTSIAAGFTTVVDGAFLRLWQRQAARRLADEMGVPYLIVAFRAQDATLRERISERSQTGHDASDADLEVLERQLRMHDPLDANEAAHCVVVDTERAVAGASPRDRWSNVLARMRIASDPVDGAPRARLA